MSTATMTVNDIDKKIVELKEQLKNVKGTPTETWSRIVGYYRPVKQWNLGKAEEYKHRVMFSGDVSEEVVPRDLKISMVEHDPTSIVENDTSVINTITNEVPKDLDDDELHYLVFFRNNCQRCPAVKEFFSMSNYSHELINAEERVDLSIKYNVMSAPTIVALNSNGEVVDTLYETSTLEKVS